MSFWDKIAGVYDIIQRFDGRAYRAMTEGVRQVVPKGAHVLDCAAGTGALTIAAAEKAESVVCTDISFSMLEQARKKCIKAGLSNVRFEERDIFSLSDKDGTYDAVMAGNVLHLLDDPKAAVKELCRVTKKGGRVILPIFLAKDSLVIKGPCLTVYKRLGIKPYSGSEYRALLDGFGYKYKLTILKGIVPIGFSVIKP